MLLPFEIMFTSHDIVNSVADKLRDRKSDPKAKVIPI